MLLPPLWTFREKRSTPLLSLCVLPSFFNGLSSRTPQWANTIKNHNSISSPTLGNKFNLNHIHIHINHKTMGNKGHSKKSNVISSIRRSFLRNVPPSVLEEMRPMMSSSAGNRGNKQPSGSTPRSGGEGGPGGSGGGGGPGGGGASHHHSVGPAQRLGDIVDFSIRDKTDASAKRGFRVQVPKRFIMYMIVFFLVVPLAISGYFLVRAFFWKKHYSEEEKHKVELPDLWSTGTGVEEKPLEWVASNKISGGQSETETKVESLSNADKIEQIMKDTGITTRENETENLKEDTTAKTTTTTTTTTTTSVVDTSKTTGETVNTDKTTSTGHKVVDESSTVTTQDTEQKSQSEAVQSDTVKSNENGTSETIENVGNLRQGGTTSSGDKDSSPQSKPQNEVKDEVSLLATKTKTADEDEDGGVHTKNKTKVKKEHVGAKNDDASSAKEPAENKNDVSSSTTTNKETTTQQQEEKVSTGGRSLRGAI